MVTSAWILNMLIHILLMSVTPDWIVSLHKNADITYYPEKPLWTSQFSHEVAFYSKIQSDFYLDNNTFWLRFPYSFFCATFYAISIFYFTISTETKQYNHSWAHFDTDADDDAMKMFIFLKTYTKRIPKDTKTSLKLE